MQAKLSAISHVWSTDDQFIEPHHSAHASYSDRTLHDHPRIAHTERCLPISPFSNGERRLLESVLTNIDKGPDVGLSISISVPKLKLFQRKKVTLQNARKCCRGSPYNVVDILSSLLSSRAAQNRPPKYSSVS